MNLTHDKIEKVWQESKILDNLFNKLHDEIDEVRQLEVHAETMVSINYWKGYRDGLERALIILYKTLNQNIFSSH